MFRSIAVSIAFAMMLVLSSCQKDLIAEAINKLNKAEIAKVMDACVTFDQAKIGQVADSLGGIKKKVDQVITKDVYVTYGGIENNFNLKAPKPLALVICAGNTNVFTVSKAQPFDGDIFCFTHGGIGNQIAGCSQMTFDDARKYLK